MASDTPLLGGSPLSTVTGGWSSMTHGGCPQRRPGPRNPKCPRRSSCPALGKLCGLSTQAHQRRPPDLRRPTCARPLARPQPCCPSPSPHACWRRAPTLPGRRSTRPRSASSSWRWCLPSPSWCAQRGGTRAWGDHRRLRCPPVNPLAGVLPAAPTAALRRTQGRPPCCTRFQPHAAWAQIVEVVGGIYAHSLAIITDAAHLLSDVSGFAVSALAAVYAAKRSHEHFSYG